MGLLVDVTRDAQYGARLLLKSPGSSAIAIVTLALGIGSRAPSSPSSTPSSSVRCRFTSRIGWWRSSRSPMRQLVSTLFRMRPSAADPVTYAGVALLLGAVAMAAVLVPLRRATGIDPAAVPRA
jgi:hypothetical protein